MIALDTNVVVRLLVNDDAAQARRARALLAAGHAVAAAITACEQGLGFADALHLAFSGDAERVYTFDANLRRRAPRAMPGVQVRAPG